MKDELKVAPSEKEALKRIFEKLTKKIPSLFPLSELTPGKKAGGVVK